MINNSIVPGFDDEKDETLKIKLQRVPDSNDALILVLNGYIDTYNSNSFQKRVHRAIENGYIHLIFHCGSLNYVSSTGMGSFTALLKMVKAKGGDLILVSIQPKVNEVFQLLGFSQFFNFQDNIDAAVRFFHNEIPQLYIEVFPKVFSCPICTKKLKATKSGRFRCSECKSILEIKTNGKVLAR